MKKRSIGAEQAANHLHSLIRDCDGDTLAALYEYAFGSIENAVYDDSEGNIKYEDRLYDEEPE